MRALEDLEMINSEIITYNSVLNVHSSRGRPSLSQIAQVGHPLRSRGACLRAPGNSNI